MVGGDGVGRTLSCGGGGFDRVGFVLCLGGTWQKCSLIASATESLAWNSMRWASVIERPVILATVWTFVRPICGCDMRTGVDISRVYTGGGVNGGTGGTGDLG